MTYATSVPEDFASFDRGRLTRQVSFPAFIALVSVAVGVVLAALALDARPVASPNVEPARAAPSTAIEAPAPTPKAIVASKSYSGLFDPAPSLGFPPVSLAESLPLASNLEPAAPTPNGEVAEADSVVTVPPPAVPQMFDSVPLPAPRPPEVQYRATEGPFRATAHQAARQNRTSVPLAPPPDNRTFLEKLFGMAQPSGPALGYAAPEDGVFGVARSIVGGPTVPHDRSTAVYDIAAHTVYMPDGTRLEAHSGLGDRLDDPRHVAERDRGPTPPHVYELEPRAQLFHGVQALRLNPVGNGGVFGRTGLLAHSYMLGPKGDSNGCVSFKDYSAFLQAYQNGEVKRLVVVSRSI